MKHLFSGWGEVEKKLYNKKIALFLDYDGTLVPIRDLPEKAVISAESKNLLRGLVEHTDYRLAIVSGRSLSDIKKLVGLKGIIYVGNHGLEIEGPKIKFNSPVSLRYRKILEKLNDNLKMRLSAIQGVLVEDKGLTLSVHYRLVDKGLIPSVKTIFHEATIIHLVKGQIKVRTGKMLMEIRPPVAWDKGKVVLWLLARWRFAVNGKGILPIYIGDDDTDEDAFKALERKGLTIFVGARKASRAKYLLDDVGEVAELLRRLVQRQVY